MQRDLPICKIDEILEKDTESSSSLPRRAKNYTHWNLFKNPLSVDRPLRMRVNVARLLTSMDELAKCCPRFELAGTKYKAPSKVLEVDEILNLSRNYDDI